jgi:hypothetical protein
LAIDQADVDLQSPGSNAMITRDVMGVMSAGNTGLDWRLHDGGLIGHEH